MYTFLDKVKTIHEKEKYPVLIKTVVEMDRDLLDRILAHMEKYVVVHHEGPFRTPPQKHPADFGQIEAAEVYYLHVYTELPVSPYVLREELAAVLKLPLESIVVKPLYDHSEGYQNFRNFLQDFEEFLRTRGYERDSNLSHDPQYREGEKKFPGGAFYGNDYNEVLVKQTLDYSKNHPVSKEFSNEVTDNLFGNLNVEDRDYVNFNDGIEGAPRIHKKKNLKMTKHDRDMQEFEKMFIGKYGHVHNVPLTSQPYRDKEGKRKEFGEKSPIVKELERYFRI